MKQTLTLLALSIALTACQTTPTLQPYPETAQIPVVDTYFGTDITDPYRWLEDDRSPETEAWVKAQNEVTFDYLEDLPMRSSIERRLSTLWNYEKVGAPYTEGNYTYFSKNDGLQNQSVIYRRPANDPEAEPTVFLDPNTFSEDGTTSLAGLSFSDDGSMAAYSISEGGSDWRKVIVINTESMEQIGDTLVDIKFSGISWRLNEGFFYSSYDKPDGSELSAKTDQHKLFYHVVGTSQAEDELIFGGTEAQKHRYIRASVTDDGRYALIDAAVFTKGNRLFLKDLTNPSAPLVTMSPTFDYDAYLLESEGDKLYLVTNKDAPNQRLVVADVNRPQEQYWQDVIPETEYVLSVSSGAGYFFAEYMEDAISKVYQYDMQGNNLGEIELPGLGSAGGFGGKDDAEVLYYSYTNYQTPGSTYAYDPETMTSELYWQPAIDFDPETYESTQIFYESKDGTQIPMIITHKKGVEYDGSNPTILYGYGGFNVSLTPSFSVTNAIWMEMGGVYAVPNLRGGGEYGKEWHNAGTKMNRQNVFDDFIAAAEYLMAEGVTSKEKLAIRGGSNGGLLVGAVMTQRPDLVGVALPAVGVLDMLRYHTFTAGAGWAYDYGTSEESQEMFEYLLGYSPVHNVEEGVAYPATMVTTADHDDRVVPAHSFKFAAELQAKHAGEAPVLIRIETNAGHGAGTPISKRIEQTADIYAFTLYNMGYTALPG
ncbi:MAG: prolyl oligopeptidase family serine peptidase [Bacteroidetes bacterium]|nr:prolyl oligopeptidase family serine peptidase [Bacteroidota bacterium]MDA0907725.1 prolyl oligopeptidase family serine peptidase [Bacteroidota bacterium]